MKFKCEGCGAIHSEESFHFLTMQDDPETRDNSEYEPTEALHTRQLRHEYNPLKLIPVARKSHSCGSGPDAQTPLEDD